MTAESPQTPLLIYDGDCGFCRRWIVVWKRITGDRVQYASSQEVGGRFPQISPEEFQSSVQLIDRDGSVYRGAEAVFRSLAAVPQKRWLLWAYQKIPGWAAVSEAYYRQVAAHRVFWSRMTRWVWGKHLEPSTYLLTRKIFFTGLALVYFTAFLSLGVQIGGLVGSEGILPAARFLESLDQALGSKAYAMVPTAFWFNSSDAVLQWSCWAGAFLSLVLLLRVAPALVSFFLWVLYLSLYSVGQTFLSFQWDILLLETGFLAIFFAPLSMRPRGFDETEPPRAIRWLLWWLLFRLTFQSGLVKLMSGDPSWWDGTALAFHYETQPLPTWIGYFAHQLPLWFQKVSTYLMYGFELAVPFLIFSPGRLRVFGAILMVTFQILIFLTGNYGFFNLNTVVLCALLIPDYAWPKWVKRIFRWDSETMNRPLRPAWSKIIIVPVSLVIFILSLTVGFQRIWREEIKIPGIAALMELTRPFHLVNSYGLFAVMTRVRPEITVEGSHDGIHWQAYEFRWKPGDVKGRPRFVEPHMPRLDWQMWFAALRPSYRYPLWFHNFLARLLEGSPPVLKLLKKNPFPDQPPKFVRANIARYYFTDWATKRALGAWWIRGGEQPYSAVYEREGK